MPKQPPTMSGKKPATNVDGHDIRKPKLRDADHDREVSARNDANLVGYQADAGFKEVEHDSARPHLSDSPTPDKTADVKSKET